jgi:hypothetical protein
MSDVYYFNQYEKVGFYDEQRSFLFPLLIVP